MMLRLILHIYILVTVHPLVTICRLITTLSTVMPEQPYPFTTRLHTPIPAYPVYLEKATHPNRTAQAPTTASQATLTSELRRFAKPAYLSS